MKHISLVIELKIIKKDMAQILKLIYVVTLIYVVLYIDASYRCKGCTCVIPKTYFRGSGVLITEYLLKIFNKSFFNQSHKFLFGTLNELTEDLN